MVKTKRLTIRLKKHPDDEPDESITDVTGTVLHNYL